MSYNGDYSSPFSGSSGGGDDFAGDSPSNDYEDYEDETDYDLGGDPGGYDDGADIPDDPDPTGGTDDDDDDDFGGGPTSRRGTRDRYGPPSSPAETGGGEDFSPPDDGTDVVVTPETGGGEDFDPSSTVGFERQVVGDDSLNFTRTDDTSFGSDTTVVSRSELPDTSGLGDSGDPVASGAVPSPEERSMVPTSSVTRRRPDPTLADDIGVRARQARAEIGRGLQEDPVDTVGDITGRGQPGDDISSQELAAASGFSTAIDVAFQEPTARRIRGALGLPRRDTVDISGPALTFPLLNTPTGTAQDIGERVLADEPLVESGAPGRLNTEVTDALTEGRGLFTDQQEQRLRRDIQDRREYFGVGEETEAFAEDVGAPEDVAEFVGGFAETPGELASATATGALLADLAVEASVNAPETVEEFGAEEVGTTVAEVGGRGVEQQITEYEKNPARFTGQVLGDVLAGYGAGKAVEAAPSLVRSARIRARGGDIYDVEDFADPPTRTEAHGLPGFTDDAVDDPDVARREFLEQARENDLGGDSPTAFQVRGSEAVDEYGGFGRNFEAPEGSSELPGLFQSADISNLRLPGGSGGSGLSIPRPGLPNPRTTTARVLAEEDIDVGITSGQSRREVSDFLTDQADREKSFIRTDVDGTPTPEQEVIAPPGSRFVESGGLFGVRVGGRDIGPVTVGGEVIPGRLTRRAAADDLLDVDVDDTLTAADIADETTEAILESRRRQADPTEPFLPVGIGTSAPSTSDDPMADDVAEGFDVTERRAPTSSGGLDTEAELSTVITPEGSAGTGASESFLSPTEAPSPTTDETVTGRSGGSDSATPVDESPPSGGTPTSSGAPSSGPPSLVPPSKGPPSSGPPSSGPPSRGPPTIEVPPSGPATVPPPTTSTPPEEEFTPDERKDEFFGAALAGDYIFRFGSSVATPEDVLANFSTGTGGRATEEPFVEDVDTDLTPRVSSVEGTPSSAEERALLDDLSEL